MMATVEGGGESMGTNQTVEQLVDRFTLMDDPFMTTVFKDNIPATELVLQIILDRKDLKVSTVQVQETLKNLRGHSLRLDILASDSEGKQYNIEFQNDSAGASSQRARYHSALLDANNLPAGEDFRALPETYVVFITHGDVLGKKLPIYHINRMIEEDGTAFGDGTHIVYVNGACQDATPLGKLMQDFHSETTEGMNYELLRQQMHFYKNEEGRKDMCAAVEEYARSKAKEMTEAALVKGRAEGKAEGKAEGQKEMITSLLKAGIITPEQIALATNFSLDDVNRLANSLKQ